MKKIVFLVMSIALFGCAREKKGKRDRLPNILIIYVDDLGYGDVGCYGAQGVKTPNIDLLARNGLSFTDAHCSAATCTPSRFSLLTGSYAFRNKAEILPGDAPLLIRPGTPTLPGMLQKQGYTTAVIGKWHLGLGDGEVNWNGNIAPGPMEIGFDYSFIIPATGDRVPCVWVEDHNVVGLDPNDPIEVSYSELIGDEPTGLSHPELLKQKADTQHSQTIINGISRIGSMKGGRSARWVDEDFADILTGKAKKFITENKEKPFFLYFSYHDIHVPRVPHPRFAGKSSMGPRGDAIFQMDWCTGQIIKTLKELGLTANTLVIFSSDNGPVLDDGYMDQAEELVGGHKPSGIFRGGKYSAYEAGTRVPTIVCWPGTVTPSRSHALISQVDLFASLASLTGYDLKKNDAPDSHNMLDTWLGKSELGRESLLEEAFSLSVRKGDWKYIAPNITGPAWLKNKNIEIGSSKDPQLFNLSEDQGEQTDLAGANPEKVKEMETLLSGIIEDGRSRPE